MSDNNKPNKHFVVKAFTGETPMIFEVGKIAKQAAGSAMVRWGDSVVLVTACSSDVSKEGIDFFPLTCEYIEKAYSAGKIPGGFFKRENKPRDAEILNARIIDRSVRPLFPDYFFNDTQIIATVMSHDGEHDTDIMALCGASMALHNSPLPFAIESGPIAGVRVGRIDNKFVINPTVSMRKESDIDIVVAVSKEDIVMVEGSALQITESDLIDALFFARKEGQKIIEVQHVMRKELGLLNKVAFNAPIRDDEFFDKIKKTSEQYGLNSAIAIPEKIIRYTKVSEIKKKVLSEIVDLAEKKIASDYFDRNKFALMRTAIVETKKRIDKRGIEEIRPIECEVGILPRTHGSALFTRGETQAIVTVTLGTREDEQRTDTLLGESSRNFMLHYNFPPFSVGEARPLRSVSRREIGHGTLAERAVERMIVREENFPYTIRIVSEITESNGSSSMASVCGSTLAMLDAGIKMHEPVAGIAMGLIKDDNHVIILSDILGDEDHFGDMDFKICGTRNGITAVQMDIKVNGLSRQILKDALEQAKIGRLHILREMEKTISKPREDLSIYAPRISTIRINPDKIREVIGPGGRIIRDIINKTGAKVDITDDGVIRIAAIGIDSMKKATSIIEDIVREAKVGLIYQGLVKRLMDFGAFIEIFPGTEGLCHISELSDARIKMVSDVLQEGDVVNVAVLNIDREGKIRLSRRLALGKNHGEMINVK